MNTITIHGTHGQTLFPIDKILCMQFNVSSRPDNVLVDVYLIGGMKLTFDMTEKSKADLIYSLCKSTYGVPLNEIK